MILVAAGSGVTPLMSILKHTLATTAKSTVSLVFSCRDQNQIIFKDELSKWQESFPERFRLIQVLTRPLPGWSGLSGRLNAEALDALFGPQENGPSVSRQAYVCGPTEFMNMVKESLESIGMDKKSIHSESFGSSHPHQASAGQAGEGPQADGSVIVGDPMADAGEKPEVIEAYFDGERVEVPAKENMSILDTLLEAGHNPPYSCMSGACTACMAKVEEGRVRQREPGSLSPENFSAREILTCQSEPMSKRVKVRFTSGD